MTIKDTLLTEFDHEMAATRRLIERLPDEKLAWKPHAKSYSLGGLATHLANLLLWAGRILNEDSFDLAVELPRNSEITSRAELLSTFDAHSKRVRGWLDKTDAELQRALVAEARRPGSLFDAAIDRVPQFRAAPHDPPSRSAHRVSAAE